MAKDVVHFIKIFPAIVKHTLGSLIVFLAGMACELVEDVCWNWGLIVRGRLGDDRL